MELVGTLNPSAGNVGCHHLDVAIAAESTFAHLSARSVRGGGAAQALNPSPPTFPLQLGDVFHAGVAEVCVLCRRTLFEELTENGEHAYPIVSRRPQQ